jgi:hypothetical protein
MNGGAFCPLCRRLLGLEFWNTGAFQVCPGCSSQVMVTSFPAMAMPSGLASVVPPESGESSCFFHPSNLAESICDGCGRFLCGLCSIKFGKRKFCPGCIYQNRRQKSDPLLVDQALLFDNIAISILLLSAFTLIYLFLGLVISLLSICLVFVGWRYQRTLVRRSRIRFGIALILALIGGGGWIVLLLLFIHSLPHYA